MRHRLLALGLGVCALVAQAERPKEAFYFEASSYEEAMDLAGKEDRRVYLLFKGSPCSWCDRQMVEIKDRVVAESMDGTVFCVVDAYERRDLCKMYGVGAVPAHRVTDPKGSTLKAHTGFMEAKKLASFIRD